VSEKSCFTRHLLSGRIFSNFPATLAGKVRNNLATVLIFFLVCPDTRNDVGWPTGKQDQETFIESSAAEVFIKPAHSSEQGYFYCVLKYSGK
jgi:hypothetical protein